MVQHRISNLALHCIKYEEALGLNLIKLIDNFPKAKVRIDYQLF